MGCMHTLVRFKFTGRYQKLVMKKKSRTPIMSLELSRRRWTLISFRSSLWYMSTTFSKRGLKSCTELLIDYKIESSGDDCLCFLVQKFETVLQNLWWISWIPWVHHVFSCLCLGSIITYTHVWFHLVCLFYKKDRKKRRQKDKKDAFQSAELGNQIIMQTP